MAKYKLEYIWLDGYTPVPNLRGKTQIKEFDSFPTLEQLPLWGFDGSSTRQAEGTTPIACSSPSPSIRTAPARTACSSCAKSCCPTASRRIHQRPRDHSRRSGRLVRLRAGIFPLSGRPSARLPRRWLPAPQGPYYTGVGYKNVGDIARQIVEEHLDLCLDAGINHEGINAEVAKGQWEFQIFGKGSKKAADEMWIARYILQRLGEKYGVDIEYHCKPLGDTDWNGSGMHANFSTTYLREKGGKEYFEALMAAFEKNRSRSHRRLRSGQPSAPDRQARDRRRSTLHLWRR